MESVLQLIGFLILTFLAIVVPFFTIMLSLFQEGVSRLTAKYESEKSKSEENLKSQLAKRDELEGADLNAIEQMLSNLKQSIKEIKTIKKTAQTKLFYLNPKKQIIRLFFILLVSFTGIISAILTKTNIYFLALSILISIGFFIFALIILWKLIGIIIEVKYSIDDERRGVESRTLEALLSLPEKLSLIKEGMTFFLKDLYISIQDLPIKDDKKEISMNVNVKASFQIKIHNNELRMAKNLECGLVFPSTFVIERNKQYSIYTEPSGEQVVRYKDQKLHGRTYHLFEPLILTPIKEGEYQASTFIKAENVEVIHRVIKVIVR